MPISPNMVQPTPGIPTPVGGQPQAQWREDYFVYVAEVEDLDPAGSTQVSIQIDADSHFKWIETTYFGFGVGEDPQQTDATRIVLPITMQVTDGSSGRNLFSNALPLSLVAGNGQLPFFEPIPRIFPAKSNFLLTFSNFGLEDFHFWVAFIGVKMFKSS